VVAEPRLESATAADADATAFTRGDGGSIGRRGRRSSRR
jgi:hypothetical protein